METEPNHLIRSFPDGLINMELLMLGIAMDRSNFLEIYDDQPEEIEAFIQNAEQWLKLTNFIKLDLLLNMTDKELGLDRQCIAYNSATLMIDTEVKYTIRQAEAALDQLNGAK